MNSEQIIPIVSSLCVGLATIIPLVYNLVKYVKKSVQEKNWQSMVNLAFKLMSKAEGMFDNGADRLDYVVAMVKSAADEINYQINEEQLKQFINDTVALTKVVNYPKDNKKTETKTDTGTKTA